MDPIKKIQAIIESAPIVLFMKGTPQFPQCGFSMRTVEAVKACEAEFEHVDVYAEPDVRENLPKFSEWPTFPQLFVKGELVGGCDIVLGLFQSGELQALLKDAQAE